MYDGHPYMTWPDHCQMVSGFFREWNWLLDAGKILSIKLIMKLLYCTVCDAHLYVCFMLSVGHHAVTTRTPSTWGGGNNEYKGWSKVLDLNFSWRKKIKHRRCPLAGVVEGISSCMCVTFFPAHNEGHLLVICLWGSVLCALWIFIFH